MPKFPNLPQCLPQLDSGLPQSWEGPKETGACFANLTTCAFLFAFWSRAFHHKGTNGDSKALIRIKNSGKVGPFSTRRCQQGPQSDLESDSCPISGSLPQIFASARTKEATSVSQDGRQCWQWALLVPYRHRGAISCICHFKSIEKWRGGRSTRSCRGMGISSWCTLLCRQPCSTIHRDKWLFTRSIVQAQSSP